MTKKYDISGQSVRYKNNDNAPSVYSAPCHKFKAILRAYANSKCSRCSGTGYIGRFKMYSSGRCYQCLPDTRWDQTFGQVKGTGKNDQTGEIECHIIFVSQPVFTKEGYAVVKPGYPPIPPFDIFDSFESAAIFAKKNFDV